MSQAVEFLADKLYSFAHAVLAVTSSQCMPRCSSGHHRQHAYKAS